MNLNDHLLQVVEPGIFLLQLFCQVDSGPLYVCDLGIEDSEGSIDGVDFIKYGFVLVIELVLSLGKLCHHLVFVSEPRLIELRLLLHKHLELLLENLVSGYAAVHSEQLFVHLLEPIVSRVPHLGHLLADPSFSLLYP